jgi:hypothetical protein
VSVLANEVTGNSEGGVLVALILFQMLPSGEKTKWKLHFYYLLWFRRKPEMQGLRKEYKVLRD